MEIVVDVVDDSVASRPSVGSAAEDRSSSSSYSVKCFAEEKRRRAITKTNERALKELNFISSESKETWRDVEERFDKLTAKTNARLHFSSFGDCIGVKEKDFAVLLFRTLARMMCISTDSLSILELKDFWGVLNSKNAFDLRLQIFIDMVDKDGDGRITKNEVKEIIDLSASSNRLLEIKKKADVYAALIMEELDPHNLGYVSVENLEMLLRKASKDWVTATKSERLSESSSEKLKRTKCADYMRRAFAKLKYWAHDNWRRIWLVALWACVVLGLFVWKFVEFKNKVSFGVMGYCVCVAKGGAETLKFNMALVLLPVCRNTITWLRNCTRLSGAVPFDDNINFHKIVACAISVGVALHAGGHMACNFPRVIAATEEEYRPLRPYFGDKQPERYWWFVKGVEGVTGIVMVVLMAIAFFSPLTNTLIVYLRKEKMIIWEGKEISKKIKILKKISGFNTFWYTHNLFVVVYALLIVHGICLYLTKAWYQKTTWMYVALPVLLYFGERVARALRSTIKAVEIIKVISYQDSALVLHMTKPQGFEYKSGQYMFVKCPTVSSFEWHPFSLTSAPLEEHLSVHIRVLGDWTRETNKAFLKSHEKLPKITIDGPYGAPAQDYKKYDVVMLVGLGIGATPMISILKNIIATAKCGGGDGPCKAYFNWSTREEISFNWFRSILKDVEEANEAGVIEIQLYSTGVYEEGDARSVLISMIQSLHYDKSGFDIIAGTQTKLHFGRPKWPKEFKRIALQHPNSTIGVFYCGPPQPVKELRKLSSHFSQTTSTTFEFHKENF